MNNMYGNRAQKLNRPEASTYTLGNDTSDKQKDESAIYLEEIGSEERDNGGIDLSLNRENILKGIIFSEIIGKAGGRYPRNTSALSRK